MGITTGLFSDVLANAPKIYNTETTQPTAQQPNAVDWSKSLPMSNAVDWANVKPFQVINPITGYSYGATQPHPATSTGTDQNTQLSEYQKWLAQQSKPVTGNNDGGRGEHDTGGAWGKLSPAEQAAYYSEHPTEGMLANLAQDAFATTSYGKIAQTFNPQGWTQARLIHEGIVPATNDRSLGNYSLGQPLGQDNSKNFVTARDADGFGFSVSAPRGDSLSISTEGREGMTAPAPSGDGFGLSGANTQAAGMNGGTGLSVGGVNAAQASSTSPSIGSSGAHDAGSANTGGGGYGIGTGGYGKPGEAGGGYATGGGGGGGGGNRVICTYLYQNKLMDKDLWEMDLEFTKNISNETINGYHYWAIPYVELMRKHQWAVKLAQPLAQARAEEVAYQLGKRKNGNFFGKIVRLIGEPICFAIGMFVGEQDWQKLYKA